MLKISLCYHNQNSTNEFLNTNDQSNTNLFTKLTPIPNQFVQISVIYIKAPLDCVTLAPMMNLTKFKK